VRDADAYVVLKALAFDSRGENKDAYDLFYVVRNYGVGLGWARPTSHRNCSRCPTMRTRIARSRS
jgi:hypothetical protein